jgi:hypothetical protein
MTENVTVQISIKLKQNNRTKTSDAIIWYKKRWLSLSFSYPVMGNLSDISHSLFKHFPAGRK